MSFYKSVVSIDGGDASETINVGSASGLVVANRFLNEIVKSSSPDGIFQKWLTGLRPTPAQLLAQ